MTEKEAKTKWCPFVRHGSQNLTRGGAECNSCIGSECVMCRWTAHIEEIFGIGWLLRIVRQAIIKEGKTPTEIQWIGGVLFLIGLISVVSAAGALLGWIVALAFFGLIAMILGVACFDD